jgi:hypothetical protein
VRLEVIQSYLLLEFAAKFNVHNHPLGVFAGGLRVIVWVLGIKGGFCDEGYELEA